MIAERGRSQRYFTSINIDKKEGQIDDKNNSNTLYIHDAYILHIYKIHDNIDPAKCPRLQNDGLENEEYEGGEAKSHRDGQHPRENNTFI